MAKKIFLDTNILLRFLVNDVPEQHEICSKLMSEISKGNFTPYFSSIVVLELVYILNQTYKKPKKMMLEKIEKLLELRNLTFIEKSDTNKALALFKKYKIKYGDCLIATQIPEGVTLVTYDKEFKKIPRLITRTPGEALKTS